MKIQKLDLKTFLLLSLASLAVACSSSTGGGADMAPRPDIAAPNCTDHIKNGAETDVDCGGSCTPCALGKGCAAATDCTAGSVCTASVCAAPGCTDHIKNGAETDVDCGGTCSPCSNGQGCNLPGDCASMVCTGAVCQAATCTDGVRNGSETDVDCGGTCSPCGNGKACKVVGDCASMVCGAGVCLMASCGDGVKNGDETDADCGGSCGSCTSGKGCAMAKDCVSLVCTAGVCAAPNCTDGVQNGTEADVDCGGTCAPCALGKKCAVSADCTTAAVCEAALCRLPVHCGELITAQPTLAGKDGTYTIDTDKSGPLAPFSAWCDMTMNGGGWTLVGRTNPVPNPVADNGCAASDSGSNFGWTSAQGSIGDDTHAYSMNAVAQGLAFTQILWGSYATGKTWGGNVFMQTVVAGFLGTYSNSHFNFGTPTTLVGGCPATAMFNYLGFTANTDCFHMRDVDGNGFGLCQSHFFTCYPVGANPTPACYAGNVNGQQGMIMVR